MDWGAAESGAWRGIINMKDETPSLKYLTM